jgi:HEAT repeat protein
MPVTMEQVRKALDPEEPDYAKATKLGADALPHLAKLIAGKDIGLASKAASLAGMIGGQRSVPVLEKAAAHKDPRVRVAAAHSAQHLPIEGASAVLAPLVADADIGVQKVALRSVPSRATAELRLSVENVAKRKSNPTIQELSKQALAKFR